MRLRDDIREKLVQLFKWVGEDYRESLAKPLNKGETGRFGYSFEEPEITEVFPEIENYFLRSDFDKSKLHLDKIDSAGQRTPPFTEGELFQMAFEQLLEWAGLSIYLNPTDESAKGFLEQFENALDKNPTDVTYIPMYGVYPDQHFRLAEPFQLSEHTHFGFLNDPIRRLLRFALEGPAENDGAISLDNSPQFIITVSKPYQAPNVAIKKAVDRDIQSLRVFFSGLFSIEFETPCQHTGTCTPMTPWNYRTGSLSQEFKYESDRRCFRDNNLAAINRYWEALHPDVLSRYSVTSSRLLNAKKRKFWADQVVDLAIALESLFSGRSELSRRYRTIIPALLKNTPEEKIELHNRIKEFYQLRSIIVHGDTVGSQRRLKEKFEAMDKREFDQEMKVIENSVREYFKLQLLNERLRQSSSESDIIFGKELNLITNPFAET